MISNPSDVTWLCEHHLATRAFVNPDAISILWAPFEGQLTPEETEEYRQLLARNGITLREPTDEELQLHEEWEQTPQRLLGEPA